MVPSFQLSDFIEMVKDEDYEVIIRLTKRELFELDRYLESGRKGVGKRRQSGALGYRDEVDKFLFFMESGTKPSGISTPVFRSFRPVCENLVKKGRMAPAVLELFGKADGEMEA
jgi:hypothetical protein